MSDLIDIYDDRLQHIGVRSRADAHTEGLWHKTFHCWIVSKDAGGNAHLLFQRRSASKDIGPNSLDISAAGHLAAGEQPGEGLRELEEELGVRIEAARLKFLGVHLEVYADDRHINREFQYVYLLHDDRALDSYRVQPEEVVGLTEVELNAGIALFTGTRAVASARSVVFDKSGAPSAPPFYEELGAEAFLGAPRNNYFIKMFLLAKAFMGGEQHLYI